MRKEKPQGKIRTGKIGENFEMRKEHLQHTNLEAQ